ncbi:MAG TPA: nitrilase-related carbon-nitrogen hydrolase [Thermoanaerobaculia bacterium]|nr:nitrilase-related carbon-nitrogen hydrolase [Thermoanaerobaculia bacterium]
MPRPALSAVLAAAAAFFLATGLEGWPLLAWLAPLPILLVAPRLSAKLAFGAAFLAHLLGGLSLFSYLAELAPIPAVVAVLAIPALAFALAVLAQRFAWRWLRHGASVLVFPAAWTSYEVLISTVSPNGTFGSLAYTQTDFLPLVQLASATGLWGITFLLTLLPTGLAAGWLWRRERGRALPALLVPVGLVLLACGWGWLRIAGAPSQPAVRVAASATDETLDAFATEDREKALAALRVYAGRIADLAGNGAQVVVLPEKLVGIAPAYEEEARALLSETARASRVTLVAGLNLVARAPRRNLALVLGAGGEPLAEYDKVFLVPGWERAYRPGDAPALFTVGGHTWATAICKDLDFPAWLRRYSRGGARLLLVPAWDFVRDRRLHARMAVMRGVEGGFAVVRSTQEGLATISDAFGRILAEAPSAPSPGAQVVAEVPLGPGSTLYARLGDWFGFLAVGTLVFVLGVALRSRPTTAKRSAP